MRWILGFFIAAIVIGAVWWARPVSDPASTDVPSAPRPLRPDALEPRQRPVPSEPLRRSDVRLENDLVAAQGEEALDELAEPEPAERRAVAPEDHPVVVSGGETIVLGEGMTVRFSATGVNIHRLEGDLAQLLSAQTLFMSTNGELVLTAGVTEDGLQTTWHDEETRAAEGWIENGKRVGAWSEWHPNGALAARGEYFWGVRNGFWEHSHAGGEPSAAGHYLYGEREGTWNEWHPSGKKTLEGVYRNGKLEGQARTWHLGGGLASAGAYRDGQPDGRWTNWFADGSIESRGSYRYGRREGRWEFIAPDGSLDPARSGRYENGERADD